MVNTAGYASYEAHFRLVIESYAVQRLDGREGRIALRHKKPSVIEEGMSFFGYLQTTWHGLGYRQLEITVDTAGVLGVATPYRIAVENEADSADRDGTHVIEHAAGQTDTARIDEDNILLHALISRQRNNRRSGFRTVIAEFAVLRSDRHGVLGACAVVQTVETEITRSIGRQRF